MQLALILAAATLLWRTSPLPLFKGGDYAASELPVEPLVTLSMRADVPVDEPDAGPLWVHPAHGDLRLRLSGNWTGTAQLSIWSKTSSTVAFSRTLEGGDFYSFNIVVCLSPGDYGAALAPENVTGYVTVTIYATYYFSDCPRVELEEERREVEKSSIWDLVGKVVLWLGASVGMAFGIVRLGVKNWWYNGEVNRLDELAERHAHDPERLRKVLLDARRRLRSPWRRVALSAETRQSLEERIERHLRLENGP